MTSPPNPEFYTARDLSKRWKASEKTLERWRMDGTGPAYLKIGGRVLYATETILTHERARTRTATGAAVSAERELRIADILDQSTASARADHELRSGKYKLHTSRYG